VADDPEAEPTVAAGVFECMMVGTADRNATKDERTGAIGSLGTTLSIPGARDGVELLQFALGDLELRKNGTDRCRRGRFRSKKERVKSEALKYIHSWPASLLAGIRNVTEPLQNGIFIAFNCKKTGSGS